MENIFLVKIQTNVNQRKHIQDFDLKTVGVSFFCIRTCFSLPGRRGSFSYFWVFKCQISACRFLNHPVLIWGVLLISFLQLSFDVRAYPSRAIKTFYENLLSLNCLNHPCACTCSLPHFSVCLPVCLSFFSVFRRRVFQWVIFKFSITSLLLTAQTEFLHVKPKRKAVAPSRIFLVLGSFSLHSTPCKQPLNQEVSSILWDRYARTTNLD